MIGALAQMGARRRSGASGGVAPTITVAPILTWTVAHGSSPTITDGTYTGDAGTWTYDLVRLPSTTVLSGVSKATVEAYVADRATDVGPDWKVTGTITNGSGSDAADSNTVAWYPDVWSGVRGLYDAASVTLVGSDVDTWQDLSGNGNDLVAASSGVRPVHSATGFNGGSQPYVEGDGVTEWLRDLTFSWGGAPTQVAFHAAAHVVTPTNGRALVRYAGAGVRPALVQATSDRVVWYGFDGTGQVSTTGSITNARTVSVISAQSGTQKTRFAGVSDPSDRTDGADAHTDGNTLGAFAAHNGTVPSHLRLGMLIVRNVATPDAERLDWQAYSTWRWGLPS